MSLSSAIQTAQSILSNTSRQTLAVSRNISNAGNPDYARRDAQLQLGLAGGEVVVTRAQDQRLHAKVIESLSASSAQATLDAGLERIRSTLGGNDYELSPAHYLGDLRDSLQTLSAVPGDSTVLATVIAGAGELAEAINRASTEVQAVRLDADKSIADGVERLNGLLAEFEALNDVIVSGTRSGHDVMQEHDQRDRLLKDISSLIGIRTLDRGSNDIALYTSDGQTLFETVARPVSFERTNGFDASNAGNAIYVDGVVLSAGEGAQTTGRGSLSAHLQLRDDTATIYQSQLDEIARGLVTVFAETDPAVPVTLPDRPGLFTWAGASVPAAGTIEPGIAATLSVNPALLAAPTLLRDGGINGPAYTANATGAAGFTQLLDGFVTRLDSPTTFDLAAQAGDGGSLVDYVSNSIGWLEAARSQSSQAAEQRQAVHTRTLEAHINVTGVSLDEEMSLLLDLEQSYKASTRLISTIDEMIEALLAATR